MSGLFDKQAQAYAAYRPTYPDELVDFVLKHTSGRVNMWDAGCGSGQAARSFAKFFDNIEATDISDEQIGQAETHSKIHFTVSAAESTPFPDDTFDLIIAAQALHWFDQAKFFAEAQRVGRPGATVAVWSYGHFMVAPEFDGLNQRLNHEIDPFWAPQIRHINNRYKEIEFPATAIAQDFIMVKRWNLDELTGYYESWSAVQKYKDAHGTDPVMALADKFAAAWGDPTVSREVRWPVHLRLWQL